VVGKTLIYLFNLVGRELRRRLARRLPLGSRLFLACPMLTYSVASCTSRRTSWPTFSTEDPSDVAT